MPRRLLIVRRRLWVRDKGLSLEPGFVPLAGERILAGGRVQDRRPDGLSFETVIRGTSTSLGEAGDGRVHLWLDLISKDEVPIGSEVWSIGD